MQRANQDAGHRTEAGGDRKRDLPRERRGNAGQPRPNPIRRKGPQGLADQRPFEERCEDHEQADGYGQHHDALAGDHQRAQFKRLRR